MSLSLLFPTIFNLNDDALLYIFTINADMFTDVNALDTTRITSQVCHTWRNLMFSTPSLWARLIDMNNISYSRSNKWLHELVRRSGDAPLWIRASSVCPTMDTSEFCDIIGKNWHRIQKLVVLHIYPFYGKYPIPLALGFPAPQLETFDVSINYQICAEDNEEAPPARLFGGCAPVLHSFSLYSYAFDKGPMPWLCKLHTLVFKGEYSVCDILAVLSQAHSLRTLHIVSRLSRTITSPLPVVSPPHLESIEYRGKPLTCITFLDHINIPTSCSLSVQFSLYAGELDFDIAEKLVTAFTRHVRHFLQSNIFQIVDLAYIAGGAITFEAQATIPVKCMHRFGIPLGGISNDSAWLSMILSKLGLLNLTQTTTLQFHTGDRPLDPSFGLFFSCLTSLDTLCIDSNALDRLIVLQNDMNTSQPDVIFPTLKTIDFIIVQLKHDNRQITGQISVAVNFILSRVQNDHPLARLNIGDILPFDAQADLDALAEVKDLEVFFPCLLAMNHYRDIDLGDQRYDEYSQIV